MTRYPRNIFLVLAIFASACGDPGGTTSDGSDTTAPTTGDTTGATTSDPTTTAEPTTDAATGTTGEPTTDAATTTTGEPTTGEPTSTTGETEATTSESTATTGEDPLKPPSQLCVDYCAMAKACCAEGDACFVADDCLQTCDLTLKLADYIDPTCGEQYGEVLKCAATDCRATIAYENESGACFDMYVATSLDPTCQMEALPGCVEACKKYEQCEPNGGGAECENECTGAILVYKVTGDAECAQAYEALTECIPSLTCEQIEAEEGCEIPPGLECE